MISIIDMTGKIILRESNSNQLHLTVVTNLTSPVTFTDLNRHTSNLPA